MATQVSSDPNSEHKPEPVSISPLLKRLAYPASAEIPASAAEISSAFALIFEDKLSVIQTAALLTLLHSTGKDKEADVIAACSERMREAASQVDRGALKKVLNRGKKEGNYNGGVVSRERFPRLKSNPNVFPSAAVSVAQFLFQRLTKPANLRRTVCGRCWKLCRIDYDILSGN